MVFWFDLVFFLVAFHIPLRRVFVFSLLRLLIYILRYLFLKNRHSVDLAPFSPSIQM